MSKAYRSAPRPTTALPSLPRRAVGPGGISDKFREQAIAAARAHVAAARRIEEIAAGIGIRPGTLQRWLSGDEHDPVLVPVVVNDELAPARTAVVVEPRRAGPVIILPSGARVEGLDVAEIAELLRRLG